MTLVYPAKLSVYDPALGGVNCNGDCTTIATGLFDDSMYKEVAACPAELLGATITFPMMPWLEFQCLDTGPAIKARYYGNQCVTFFDVVWPLATEDPPNWVWWEISNWSVSWE
jgi:hypothetical protein